jgi:hypothetical protein
MNALRKHFPDIKPNTLVFADLRETEGYAFIGEVMSFPTPERTAMVRRVPGHPGTLVELPLANLVTDRSIRAYKWVHYAKAEGRGSFPVDMLRYDRAAPVNFTIKDGKPVLNEGETELIIATMTRFRSEPWTKARWASFMWTVSPIANPEQWEGR